MEGAEEIIKKNKLIKLYFWKGVVAGALGTFALFILIAAFSSTC